MEYFYILIFFLYLAIKETKQTPQGRDVSISLLRPRNNRRYWSGVTTAEFRRYNTPGYYWVDSYYVRDYDYPLLTPRPPKPNTRVGEGTAIFAWQWIPLFMRLLTGKGQKMRRTLPPMHYRRTPPAIETIRPKTTKAKTSVPTTAQTTATTSRSTPPVPCRKIRRFATLVSLKMLSEKLESRKPMSRKPISRIQVSRKPVSLNPESRKPVPRKQ